MLFPFFSSKGGFIRKDKILLLISNILLYNDKCGRDMVCFAKKIKKFYKYII